MEKMFRDRYIRYCRPTDSSNREPPTADVGNFPHTWYGSHKGRDTLVVSHVGFKFDAPTKRTTQTLMTFSTPTKISCSSSLPRCLGGPLFFLVSCGPSRVVRRERYPKPGLKTVISRDHDRKPELGLGVWWSWV